MKDAAVLRKAIAIDFDGCISSGHWPDTGPPNIDVISAALQEQSGGAALILWTCRTGSYLDDALRFCKSYGLVFDAVNENLPERIAAYDSDPRKVDADEYWDDRAVRIQARV